MTEEKIPALKIIKAMIEKIDHVVKIERIKYDFDKMEHKFSLSINGKTCEVTLPRDFLDDLNDYTGSKESKYWTSPDSVDTHQAGVRAACSKSCGLT